MRIWKRAAGRKKLLKSSSEFSAIQFQQFKKIRFCDWEFYFYLDCAIVG